MERIDVVITLVLKTPQTETKSMSEITLCIDSNFGRGRTAAHIELANRLSKTGTSNEERIRLLQVVLLQKVHIFIKLAQLEFPILNVSLLLLQEQGFLVEDTMKDELLHADEDFWKYAANRITEIKFLPAGNFTLELEIPPPQLQPHDLTVHTLARNESRPTKDTVDDDQFNKIINFRPGQLVSGVSFHRFMSIDGYPLRETGLMVSQGGHKSTVAIATVKRTDSPQESQAAIKWSKSENKQGIVYERKVLAALSDVPGVVKLFLDGGMVRLGTEVLLMDAAFSHNSAFENLSYAGLKSLALIAGGVLHGLHGRGLVHRNVSCKSIRINNATNCLVFASMQYTSMSVTADEESKRRAATLGIGEPPFNPNKRNLPWFDAQPCDSKQDAFMFGAVLLSCLERDSGLFLTRGVIDLSKMNDGSEEHLLDLVINGVRKFNLYIAEADPHVPVGEGIASVICGLLHHNPDLRMSCGEACQTLSAHSVPRPVESARSLLVPARYNYDLCEMQRPFEIFQTMCTDTKGNPVIGVGLRAVGGARPGDLLCTYGGLSIDKFHADYLTAFDRGNSIKSDCGLICMGGVIDDTILSLNWLAEHGAASLANCNRIVTSKRDNQGGKFTVIRHIQATAYWDIIVLPNKRKLPIPGNFWSDVVMALRAATNVGPGEQFFVEYGSGTTLSMFVSPGDKYIVRKRTKKSPPQA
jgi:hypothetical protein